MTVITKTISIYICNQCGNEIKNESHWGTGYKDFHDICYEQYKKLLAIANKKNNVGREKNE